jgi:hypothetical protein
MNRERAAVVRNPSLRAELPPTDVELAAAGNEVAILRPKALAKVTRGACVMFSIRARSDGLLG